MVGQQVVEVIDRLKIDPLQARAPEPIDHEHLARYTMGDRALELEVLELFSGQAGRCVEAMASAQTQKCWRDAAHGLKGSASAVGAWNVANLAYSAEMLDSANVAQRAATLEAIRAALQLTTGYIAIFSGEKN
jgi:HPt (histidine-containing phosphotransfer) domain-containing protein